MSVEVEEIKSLKIRAKVFEINTGKGLTTIDCQPNGKSVGRDIVLRNDELDDFISALTTVREWLKKEFGK